MFRRTHSRTRGSRRGAATAELAILLPFLAFLFVVAVDFCRVFYFSVTLANCARNGALYGCDPASPLRSKYADYRACAIADGANLAPALTVANVTSSNGSDAYGSTVSVTVSYDVDTLSSYLGFEKVSLKKTVTMRVLPLTPN